VHFLLLTSFNFTFITNTLTTYKTSNIINMSDGPQQAGDKKSSDAKAEDPSHPGMSPDPAERGAQLGHENAQGGQSVGTGGHGEGSGNAGM
jgi:hypothetical protein